MLERNKDLESYWLHTFTANALSCMPRKDGFYLNPDWLADKAVQYATTTLAKLKAYEKENNI